MVTHHQVYGTFGLDCSANSVCIRTRKTEHLGSKFQKMNHHCHAVRTKQKVLGRKVKTDVGKPGIARAKAIQLVGSVLVFKCVCWYVIVH